VYQVPELNSVLYLDFLVNIENPRRLERLPRILAGVREERSDGTCDIGDFSFLEQFGDRFECELELMSLYRVVNRRDLNAMTLLQDMKTTVYKSTYSPVITVIGNNPSVVEVSQR
jgi:hypothetical protein